MEYNKQDKQKEQKKTKKNLQLDIKTWNTDSIGIFNYKEKLYKIAHDEANKDLYYIRNDNNYINKKESQILFEDNGEILFRVRKSLKDYNKYEIINPLLRSMKKNEININTLNNASWYVIRPETDFCENENEKYILNENDILKFGRKKYEIIKMNINSSNKNINKENHFEYNISQTNKKKGSIFNINIEPYQYSVTENYNNENVKNNNNNVIKTINKVKINNKKEDENNNNNSNNVNDSNKDNTTDEESEKSNKKDKKNNKNNSIRNEENERCRICFSVESTKENPKLRICSCRDYIHFECLKKYINIKMEIHDNSDFTVQTFVCPKFNCEVCLAPYPLRFRIKEYNKIYELIDYNIASELDYLVLESLDYIKNGMNFKLIHVVQLNKDKISIGRNVSNDIIDNDISVSRNHAVLNYNREKGYVTIENRSEKFGTLVLIKGNIPIKEKRIGFQVGKSYISACMIEKDENEDNKFKNEKTT